MVIVFQNVVCTNSWESSRNHFIEIEGRSKRDYATNFCINAEDHEPRRVKIDSCHLAGIESFPKMRSDCIYICMWEWPFLLVFIGTGRFNAVCICVVVHLYVCVCVCQQKVIFCLLKVSSELWFVTSRGYCVVDVFCNLIEFLFLHSKPNLWYVMPP